MSNPDCCRSFCDGCPWAEEQKIKLLNSDEDEQSKIETSEEKAS